MAWSTPDLTAVSNVINAMLTDALSNAQVGNVKVSCNSPDAARDDTSGLCILTLYLLHIGRDPFWRNTPVAGPRPQLNTSQPLSLNLSYLLTAYHKNDFASEQLAMSVALQAIHSQPVVRPAQIQHTPLAQWLADGEFTISIEADTIEEMSRLWQAITSPIRLSALVRAAVVFLAPATPPPAVMPAPTVANLALSPQATAASLPLLFAGGAATMQPALTGGDGSAPDGSDGPMTCVAGGSLFIAGNGLTLAQAAQVFLRAASGGAEWDVTGWRQAASTSVLLVLTLPAAYADPASAVPVPPTATPLPGLYTLTVGSTALSTRANAIPLVVAPLASGVLPPGQLKPDGTGLYTVPGAGFVPSATVVALGGTALAPAGAAAPNAGQYAVNPAGTSVTFRLPTPQPPNGDYPVRIQVNGIAAAPGWVVVIGP